MSAEFSVIPGASGSSVDCTADELSVLAESCDRIAEAGANHTLGPKFRRLALALRENPVRFDEMGSLIEACETARRREEALIGEEVNLQARLIGFGLRHLLMRKYFDGDESRSDNVKHLPESPPPWMASLAQAIRANSAAFSPATAQAIADSLERLRLPALTSRRGLAARLEASIGKISKEDNVLMRSLSDYASELRAYRNWASQY